MEHSLCLYGFGTVNPSYKMFRSLRVVLFILLSTLSIAGAFTSPRCTTFLSASTALSASVDSATMAEVKVGDTIPSLSLKELVSGEDSPKEVNIADIIAGKKVAIFGVPGAFTPGCSKSHLPSFMEAQDDLKAKGVDLTICIATNDAYVMEVRFLSIWNVLVDLLGIDIQLSPVYTLFWTRPLALVGLGAYFWRL